MLRSVSVASINDLDYKNQDVLIPSKLEHSDILTNLKKKSRRDKSKKNNKLESSDDEEIEHCENENKFSNEPNILLDADEERLQGLVFGAEKSIVDNMIRNKDKDIRNKETFLKLDHILIHDKNTEIADNFKKRKSAWEDENDQDEKNKIPQQQSTSFLKYYGMPMWADLDNKNKKSKKKTDRKEQETDEQSDTEQKQTDNIFQQTGNFLVDPRRINSSNNFLPKKILDFKTCTDANKEDPDKGRLKCIEFHPSARVLLTAGLNQKLTLFQIDGKKNSKIQSIFIDRYPILAAHFTKTGDEIILGSHHKSFYYYDMIAGKLINVAPPVKSLGEYKRPGMSSKFEISPDDRLIAFVGSQGQIHLFSCRSKEWINTLKINDSCNCLTFSSDSRYLFAFGDDKDVHVFDMNDRGHKCLYKFTDSGCLSGTSIAVSNNNQFIATGCKSGVVNIYNLRESLQQTDRNPKPLKSFMNLTTACTSLKFNNTNEILATCSSYAENACKLIHMSSLSVFSNFPLNNINDSSYSQTRIPQCIDFSINSGYFSIGNHKGNALLYRLKHYGSY